MKLIYEKININFQALVAIIAVSGAVVYRIYSLNWIGIAITIILTISIFGIFLYIEKRGRFLNISSPFKKNLFSQNPNIHQTFKNFYLIFFYLLAVFLCFRILITSSTSDSIISPWEVVPGYFFFIYALASCILFLHLYNSGRWSLPLISLHYFLSFSILIFVFQIGFGFDPFIHRSTLRLIAEKGFVDPKPYYYIGQYALEIFSNKLFSIPIEWTDKLLVPLMTALFLPVSLYYSLKKWFSDNNKLLLVILGFLSLPFSFFILTTPQNLAYLFLILAILFGLKCENYFELGFVYIFSLASLACQPIAGIPALIYCFIITVFYSDIKAKAKIYSISFLLLIMAASLPLAFHFLNKTISSEQTSVSSFDLSLITEMVKIHIPGQAGMFLNFVYLFFFNNFYFLVLLGIIGLAVACKYREKCRIFFLFVLMSVSLFISYFVSATLPFSYLISYERSDYLQRIIMVAFIFLLPLFILAFYGLLNKILQKNNFIKLAWLCFAVALLTSTLYLSYPRYDSYFNSHGYSVGKYDIDAVHWINANSSPNHIVLANQQVSAAALNEYGFAKYYKNDIFYYPIPTGGLLYQYYLDMVYKKPDYDTASKAMDLAGVNEAYFVLNKYWWAYPKVLAEAKLDADSWVDFGNGQVYVFKYKKNR